jgi:hypothetical protein
MPRNKSERAGRYSCLPRGLATVGRGESALACECAVCRSYGVSAFHAAAQEPLC